MEKKISKHASLVALLVVLAASTCACGGTQVAVGEEGLDPTQILANFAVFRISTQTPDGPGALAVNETNGAGAIFYSGPFTLALQDTLVQVIPPAGQPLTLVQSNSGPPLNNIVYSVALASFDFNSQYRFRVSFPDGNVVENSIVTPLLTQALSIASPLPQNPPSSFPRNDPQNPITLVWTGNRVQQNLVSVLFKQMATSDLLLIYGLGKQILDDNSEAVVPANGFLETNDLGTGSRMLSITRRKDASAGGFAPLSVCRAALISQVEVNLTDTP